MTYTVTLERLFSLIKPLTHKQFLTPLYCTCTIIFAWLVALATGYTPSFIALTDHSNIFHYVECAETFVVGYDSIMAYLLGFEVIWLISMISSFGAMYVIVHRHLSFLKKTMPSNRNIGNYFHAKAAKTQTILTMVYLICWCPFIFSTSTSTMCFYFNKCGFGMGVHNIAKLTTPLALFAFIHPFVNPIIYIYRNEVIRTAVIEQFRCRGNASVRKTSNTSKGTYNSTRSSSN